MEQQGSKVREKPNIEGDKVNIFLLILMYSFQGVPMGLAIALPIIFQKRKISYMDQAEFSLAIHPYSFKLLWAPIIDCVFSRKFGRRKTWVIPANYLIGIMLLLLSLNLDDWLGSQDGTTQKPRIRILSVVVFIILFSCTVQDIALDGWSLTMLQKRNIQYAGTCQQIGETLGIFMAYVVFIILDSKDVCNWFRVVPREYGFVRLADFILFWSLVFIISNTIILICKPDNSLEVIGEDEDGRNNLKLGPKESYKRLWNIVKLGPVKTLTIILLTHSVGVGPLLSVAHLNLMDAGLSQDVFVLLTLPAAPIQMILSVVLRRYITGPRSLHAFVMFLALLLMTSVVLAVIQFVSQYVRGESGVFPTWCYLLFLIGYNTKNVFRDLMLLSVGTFFCRVSDPRYGGTYRTLLTTMCNIGENLSRTLSLWCVDLLTIRACVEDKTNKMVENCVTKLDGYYLETVIFTLVGAVWLCWSTKYVKKLEELESSAWIAEKDEET